MTSMRKPSLLFRSVRRIVLAAAGVGGGRLQPLQLDFRNGFHPCQCQRQLWSRQRRKAIFSAGSMQGAVSRWACAASPPRASGSLLSRHFQIIRGQAQPPPVIAEPCARQAVAAAHTAALGAGLRDGSPGDHHEVDVHSRFDFGCHCELRRQRGVSVPCPAGMESAVRGYSDK